MGLRGWLGLAVVLLLTGLPVQAQARVILVSSGEYPPWSGESLPGQGLVNRIVAEAFRREGVDVRFRFYPWRRALEVLRNGGVQASSFWFEDESRNREFLYSAQLSEHREVLFHRRDTILPAWSRLEDLASFRFCATRGYTYTSSFWLLVGNGTLRADESSSDEICLRKLLAGRVDVFPMDESAGRTLLASGAFPAASAGQLAINEQVLRVQAGHLLMRRSADSIELMRRFNAGLATMRGDGTLERIRREWLRENRQNSLVSPDYNR